jgi:hydrogenase maturation protease
MSARILVAGVGNVFLGDDGFGVEVARRLLGRPLPEGVEVRDFGIRGIDLAYALLDGYDAAILVDATRRGKPPGTLYVLEPDVPLEPDARHLAVDAHGMDPAKVLGFVRAMGGALAGLRIVGCEPATLGGEAETEPAMGLSGPVRQAVDRAVAIVEDLVRRACAGGDRA